MTDVWHLSFNIDALKIEYKHTTFPLAEKLYAKTMFNNNIMYVRAGWRHSKFQGGQN